MGREVKGGEESWWRGEEEEEAFVCLQPND